MKRKKKFPDWRNEKQAARYIGTSQGFLYSRRMAEKARYEKKGPLYSEEPENDNVRYRTEDLNDWLRLYQPSTKAATKKYREACRSGRATDAREKTFDELLIDLESWMSKNRPTYLKDLNVTIMSDELDRFEEMTGMELPEDYKLLLSWRNGHAGESGDIFDPFAKMDYQTQLNALWERDASITYLTDSVKKTVGTADTGCLLCVIEWDVKCSSTYRRKGTGRSTIGVVTNCAHFIATRISENGWANS